MKQLLSTIFILLTSISIGQIAITTPATQASNVTITNITTSSVKANWSSGSGAYELVIIKPAASAVSAPVNANMSSYSSSTVYGSGSSLGNSNYVVYKGSASNFVTITGLVPNINYEVIVYSYNYGCTSYFGSSCIQTGYLVKTTYSSTNSELHYTLATEPTSVPTLSLIGSSATTATFNVTGTGATWSMISVRDKTIIGSAPVDGTYYSPSTIFGNGAQVGGTGTMNYSCYFNSATGTLNLSNLQPATSYWARAYSINGTGSSTNNSYNYFSYDSQSFSTYNNAPTLNSISNYTLCQDAPTTTISLSGIGDGSSVENQTVSITAYSNNTALIPDPTITYSHPNTSGLLSFNVNAGLSGTAIISVYADDAGPNNNQSVRTFTVLVKGIPAAAGTISTATTTLCKVKNGVLFTVPPIANTTAYNWTLPPNATITAGANTNSITVNFSVTANSYNVKVYGSNLNGCGSGANSSLLVNFDDVPTTANAGPNQLICNNLFGMAANTPVVGIGAWTYCSAVAGALSPTTSPNANLSVLNNQTVTAVWTVTNGVCPASNSTVTITNINGSASCNPDADFLASNTSPCVGSSITYTSTSVGATSYTWSFGATATPSVSNSSIVSVAYSSIGLKTVTLTINSVAGLDTETKTNYINVITTPSAPLSISGNTYVCQGKTAEPYSTATITTASGYNWTFPSGVTQNTGGTSSSVSANFSATASNGNIEVSAFNTCGFSSVTTLSVTASLLPTTAPTITGSNTICQGENAVIYVANNLNNAISYTWGTPNGANIIGGLNTKTITVSYGNSAVSGTISAFGTNTCGIGGIKNKPITVNPLPGAAGFISGSTSNLTCPLSTNINYSIAAVSNATAYAWVYPVGYSLVGAGTSNSIFLDASIGASNGVIKVVAMNACGNGDTSNVLAVNIDGLPTQQICVVTVDSLSTHNEIFWQKNGVSNVDSFRVYRVQSVTVDTLIGTVGYSDLSRMVDLTANPNVTSFTYKIAALDFCGNEGPKSGEHQSIHLQSIYTAAPQKMDLLWNLYSGAVVSNYRVLRDTNNSGNWIPLINNLAPNATSYTDYTIPVGAMSVQYRVDVIWSNSCDPTAKVAQSVVSTTRSNTKDFVISIPTSIESQNEILNSMILYPNPTKDVFDIEFKSGFESFTVEVYNQLGSLMSSKNLTYTDKASIDIRELSSGIYFVVVKSKMGVATKRVTKL
ncbi:MAG: T9SS type A sorting domain-containing protein [Bacteroidota bacterium]